MRLGRNLIAGFASSAWSALIGLAVVPVYLKYLGIEAYGLIGFFATTQVVLQLLDFGLAPTVNREVARFTAAGDSRNSANLLHTFAIIYWGMAGLVALVGLSLAPLISQQWLRAEHLHKETIENAVMLIVLVVACRWPVGLYQGALMGAQRLTISSGISIAMVTLGSLGAIGVLAWISPTIEAFFIWQAIVGFINALTVRWVAWKVIGVPASGMRFDVVELKRIWRFSAAVSGIALSGLLLMQLDKVLLSRILNLEAFAHYSLAALVASGLYVLLTPVFNSIYPLFSTLVASGKTSEVAGLYTCGTRGLLAVLFPVTLTGILLSHDLVYLWTGDLALASNIAPILSLILIGTSLNGAMHFPYALQLAYGATRLPLTINAILVVIFVPLIILFATQFGAIGGAAAWALLNGIYLLIGTWLTHRSLLKGLGAKWLFGDVGVPLAISLLVMSLVGWQVQEMEFQFFAKSVVVITFAIVTVGLIVSTSPCLKTEVRRHLFSRSGSTDTLRVP